MGRGRDRRRARLYDRETRALSSQTAGPEEPHPLAEFFGEAASRDLSKASFDSFSRGLDEIDGVASSKVADPYSQLITIFRGINLIADALTRVPFELWRDDEPIVTGPLFEMFRQPQPRVLWRQWLKKLVVRWHSGNADIRLGERNSWGLPKVLEVVPPGRVTPGRPPGADVMVQPTGWLIERPGGRGKDPIPLEDLIRFQYAPSNDDWVGMGPFAPGRLSMDTEYLAGVYTKATLANGGTPGSILSNKAIQKIPKADRTRLENDWMAKFGPAARAAKVALLTGDWTYQNIGFSPRDMQFEKWRLFFVGEAARMLNIPPLYLAHFETSGLSDAGLKVQEKLFYWQCVIPLASALAEALTEFIVRPFDPTVVCIFNFDNVEALRTDLGAKLVAAEALDRMNVPFEAINELLEIGIDIDKYPWLREKLVMSGMTTARVAVESASLPEPVPVDAPPPPPPGGETPEEIAAREKADKAKEETAQEDGFEDRDEELDGVGRSLEETALAEDAFDRLLGDALDGAAERALEGEALVARRALTKPGKKERVAIIKKVTKAASPISNKIETKVRGVLAKQKKAVRAKLLEAAGTTKRAFLAQEIGATGRAVGDDPLDLSPSAIADILNVIRAGTVAQAIQPEMRAAYFAGAATLRDVLRAMGVTDADFTSFQRERLPKLADQYVDARLGTGLPTAVDDTTRALVNSVIINNLEAGSTLADTIKGINAVFDASLSRARTIARTETTIALNGGRYETMRDEQRVSHHMWITAGDQHVRGEKGDDFTHRKLHGRIVPVGESFATDDDLKFPGDPDAQGGNSINCRCTTAPVSDRRLESTSDESVGPVATAM